MSLAEVFLPPPRHQLRAGGGKSGLALASRTQQLNGEDSKTPPSEGGSEKVPEQGQGTRKLAVRKLRKEMTRL